MKALLLALTVCVSSSWAALPMDPNFYDQDRDRYVDIQESRVQQLEALYQTLAERAAAQGDWEADGDLEKLDAQIARSMRAVTWLANQDNWLDHTDRVNRVLNRAEQTGFAAQVQLIASH